MVLIIKNMVCPRCIMTVEQLLKDNHIHAEYVRLGEVGLSKAPTEKQLSDFSNQLKAVGFELLDDKKKKLIEKVKNLLIKKVQGGDIEDHFSLGKFLSDNIFKDYSSISKLFSEVEGITIEQFFILQKIEKTKEWLLYDEFSLGEIAIRLGYSSTQHLSGQFKKITGMTPSQFRQMGTQHRKPIDNIGK